MRQFIHESPEYERGYARCLNDMLIALSLRHEHAVIEEDIDRWVELRMSGGDTDDVVIPVVHSMDMHRDIVKVLTEMDSTVVDLSKLTAEWGDPLLEVSRAED